jgi:hypothetical protein
MGGKRSLLVVIVLAALAGLVVVGSRGRPQPAENREPSRSASFDVRVVKPLSARPLFGLFSFFETEDLGFDQASPGASARAGRDRLELSAEGWELRLEIDGDGRVAPGTRLVFPLELGGRQVRLSCRPADGGAGYLRMTPGPVPGEFGGRFLVKLAACENVKSGKRLEWPPAPLTVKGAFNRIRTK